MFLTSLPASWMVSMLTIFMDIYAGYIYVFADYIRGYEEIWVLGDGFVNRTSKDNFVEPNYPATGQNSS